MLVFIVQSFGSNACCAARGTNFLRIHVAWTLSGAIIFGSDQEVAGVMRAIRRCVGYTRHDSNWFSLTRLVNHNFILPKPLFYLNRVNAEIMRQAPFHGLEVMDGQREISFPMEMNPRSRERFRCSHRRISVRYESRNFVYSYFIDTRYSLLSSSFTYMYLQYS